MSKFCYLERHTADIQITDLTDYTKNLKRHTADIQITDLTDYKKNLERHTADILITDLTDYKSRLSPRFTNFYPFGVRYLSSTHASVGAVINLIMSIPYSGTFKRSAGLVSAIGKQLKIVNLKPVKKMQIQFDPFHENAKAVRDFLYYVSAPKIVNTNLSCLVKTNVVCDRSEPFIKIDLADSKSIKLLSGNLTVLELLQIYNKHVSSLVKPEDTTPVKLPKSTKQGKKR